MASMNRGLNLPGIQKIMDDFSRESAQMDMKEEMMTDAVDDVMEDDDELEDEETEGGRILKEVLDEIGVDLSQKLSEAPSGSLTAPVAEKRPVALGESAGPPSKPPGPGDGPSGGGGDAGGGGGGVSDEDSLQARLDALRKGS
jgi:charged multivesicular body protein 2A